MGYTSYKSNNNKTKQNKIQEVIHKKEWPGQVGESITYSNYKYDLHLLVTENKENYKIHLNQEPEVKH